MALSRSMKNLMHDSAQARRGLSKPQPRAGGMSGMISQAMQQARARQAPRRDTVAGPEAPSGPIKSRMPRGPRGPVMTGGGKLGGRNPETGGVRGPVLRPSPGRSPMTGGPRGPAGGDRMRAAVMPPRRGPGVAGTIAGKPRPPGGTFGFASRGGGGTPALQQATASARMQAMRQGAAPRPGGLPGAISGAQQQAAMQRARPAGPAALAQPRGQSIASRLGGRQGPPARRGGMARALGSGGSRRRMLR